MLARLRQGIDLLFDENSYKEMHRALDEANLALTDKKQGNLVRQLLGETDIRETASNPVYESDSLNPSQNKVIAHILGENPLSLLHGPPGTGKTTTLIYAVQALLKQRPQQLLIVAPSNTAVDVLTERLDAVGVSVVRIGNPVKVSDHLQELTLDARVDNHAAHKTIKTLEKQARAYIDMAHNTNAISERPSGINGKRCLTKRRKSRMRLTGCWIILFRMCLPRRR